MNFREFQAKAKENGVIISPNTMNTYLMEFMTPEQADLWMEGIVSPELDAREIKRKMSEYYAQRKTDVAAERKLQKTW
jgi:hypothetical protein